MSRLTVHKYIKELGYKTSTDAANAANGMSLQQFSNLLSKDPQNITYGTYKRLADGWGVSVADVVKVFEG